MLAPFQNQELIRQQPLNSQELKNNTKPIRNNIGHEQTQRETEGKGESGGVYHEGWEAQSVGGRRMEEGVAASLALAFSLSHQKNSTEEDATERSSSRARGGNGDGFSRGSANY
nr:unnamed protein product [Digitaria exilis]